MLVLAILLTLGVNVESQYDCDFFSTVNITDGKHNLDGSVTYYGITYSKEDIKEYNHIYLNQYNRIDAYKHIRGCICKYKICINLCCDYGESINVTADQFLNHDKPNYKCYFNNELSHSSFRVPFKNEHYVDIYNSSIYEPRYYANPDCHFYLIESYTEGYDIYLQKKVRFRIFQFYFKLLMYYDIIDIFYLF